MPDGTQNADTFNAPAGNSNFNGLGGVDTIVFNFALTSAQFYWVGNQVIVDTGTSHTVLTGFEIYQFTDGTVNNADGSPLIDDLYYYASNPEIWAAHTDADAHYNANGWHEKRNPNAFFNTALYLSLNPDVAAAGSNPLTHFDTSGWKEGRTPGLNFDVHQYLVANPDVAADKVDPLRHFLATGAQEGRQPFPAGPLVAVNGFDYNYYLTHNPDVAAGGGDAFQHFQTVGWKEGRNPNAFFDVKGYLQTNPDVAAAGVNPLDHYHRVGFSEGRNPSPMFDSAAYLAANPDVAAAHVDPLQHYLRFGINEGRVAIPKAVSDENGAANTLAEGAAVGSDAGVDVTWGGWLSPNLSFSLSSDTSGGGFTINTATGQVTVADSTKLDFETSGASHSYTIVVVAQDIGSTKSQAFTINITDVIPTTPVDGNAFANNVFEGAANGSTVGVTLFSDEPNGPAVIYELTNDAGGRFAVDSATGVVTVANTAALDFETGAHSFIITGRTKVGAVFTPTQDFTINLLNAAPSPIADSNAASETVNEGAAVNSLVGIDADSTDPNGPVVTWSITSDTSAGGFKIDTNGIVSVADASKINYESAPGVGHSYSVIVQAADGFGGNTSRNFSIVVNNLNPTTPVEVVDGTPGGSVTEGAAADTLVGVQASSSDVNGPAVTWSITSDTSAGGFKIDSNGVISVADASKINYESAPGAGRSYDVTVQASDGAGGTSSQVFNILVANVAPTTPTEVADGTPGGSVLEGAANNTLVGITASSSDINGPAVIWSITADSSAGGFKIDSSGVVSVADFTKINYETLTHSYDITVQASDGFNASSQVFNIVVGNVNPSTPTDNDATNNAAGIQGRIAEGGTGGPVGITALSSDPNGPAIAWSILSGSASGAFQIDSSGVVSVLNGALLDYETAPSLGGGLRGHTILVQASDTAGGTSTQTFTIEVTNLAPAAPTDTDPVGNSGGNNGIATFDATAGTLVGIHAQSTGDPAGGTVSYELTGASSAFFQINTSTGEVSVSAAGVGNLVAGTDYDIFVVAKDSTGLVSGTSTATPFKVHVQGLAPAAPTDTDTATNNEVSEAATGVLGNFGSSAYTGVTAHSTTVGVTYSIIADNSGGGFQIASDGKIYVANGALIDYESAGGSPHHYTVTVQVSDGSLTSSSNFDINVIDVAPTTPVDTDVSAGVLTDPAQGRVTFNAANGSNVGITVHASDIDGGALTYELVSNPGSRFAINSSTGVVTLADNTGLVAGTPLTFSARAVSTNGDSGTGTNVSAAQAFTVDVVANQPIVDLNGVGGGGNAGIDFANAFTEGAAAVLITDTDAAVVEPGFTNLTSATITLTNAQVGDALAVGTPGALTVNTVSGGGKITVTLSGNQPFSVYETALRSISFNNTNNAPVTGDRVITVVVNDGVNPPSNAATSTITVSATNDAPDLTPHAPAPAASAYTENLAPSALLSTGDVTDADNPANFLGGGFTVAVTAGTLQTGDQIVVLGSSGFSVSGTSLILGGHTIGDIAFAAGSATVTNLTTDATPTVVDALVKAFGFQSSSENPVAGSRTIDFTFNDGGNTGAGSGASNLVTQTVNVIAVNDAPVNHVPAGTPGVGTGDTFTFNGANTISITDVDGGANEKVTLSVTSGTLSLSGIAGLSFTVGDGTTDSTMTFTGTVSAINTALNGLVYTAPGTVGTATLTITSDDNGNTGTGGALTDTDSVTINVSSSALTGQLWYVTRDGAATDNWAGRLNSDGTAITPVLDTVAVNEKDIALDTSAGLFFAVDGLGLISYHTSDGTVADNTLDLSAFDTVDAVALDPIYGVLFVSVTTSGDPAATGILEVNYDPATGALTTSPNFLINQNTVASFVNAVDFAIDPGSRNIYYVDSSIPDSNAIYVVDYDNGSNPATTADLTPPTATLVSDTGVFLADGSAGTIVAVAIDNRGNTNAGDDVVYFLTSSGAGGLDALWYIDRNVGTTATAVTGVTLTAETIHTGLSFDSVSHSLFISDQGSSILQAHLSAIGTIDTVTHTYTTTQLIGHAPVGTPVPGATAFDTLPVATVHDTIFTEGTPVVLDPALTISDPDLLLASVTITISGGFTGNGDTLSFDTTGTAITGPASPVVADGSGNITLTLTGRDTLADYMGVLDTLTFNSGDNPTNFGANTTRTVTWHFNDGAEGDPHSTGNTKTSTITLTDVNDAPTLDVDTGSLGNDYVTPYHVGGAAVAVTGPVDIFDADTATIAFATVKLTNAQVGDVLSISGALPAGITAAIVTDTVADPDTITVTLTGPASVAAFEAALHQVVFSSSSTDTATERSLDISVDDGQAVPHLSNIAVTKINLSGNAAPVAQDDDASATEAGGLNNAVAGSNPSGNVFADNGHGKDSDAEDAPLPTGVTAGSGVVVTQVQHGVTTVAAGTTLLGTYGAVTLNADGSYSYSVDQSNTLVQGLAAGSLTPLHDQFTYTIRDTDGATDTAVLDITINGADDFAQAFADTGSMSEDAAATSFNVRANDTLDPDAGATNPITLQPGATAVGNGAANGLGIDIGDVTLAIVANQIQVTLSGTDFQKLAVGDTATITVPYRLAGGSQNSDSTLTVTVNGANDLPVANDDTGSMGEDAATTAFTVLTGAGADVLDVDRGAPTGATVGAVTTGAVSAVGVGSALGKVTGADVTVGVNASNQITVSLGANFQKLSAGETATITVGYLLHGDGADTDGANLTVTVNGANDAPVVNLLNTAGVQTTGTTATFTENGPAPPSVPVTVLPQVTLSDIDSANLAGAVVTLTNAQANDVLTISGFGAATSGDFASGIHFAITGASSNIITFSNTHTTADYQAALQAIQFNNASDNPNTTNRSFTVQVTDDNATVNAATTATLQVVGVNDGPLNAVPGAQNSVITDSDYAFTGPLTISVTDPDAGSGLIHTTVSASHGDLTVSLAGGATVFTGTNGTHTVGLSGTVTQINAALATLVYNSDAGYTDADSIQVLTNDQGNSPAPPLSDTDTIALEVIPRIWYLDDSAGALSNGSNFTSLAAFNTAHNAVSGANAPTIIYVRYGNDGIYSDTDGINLKAGETLLGQGVDLTYARTLGGTATLEDRDNTFVPTITVTGAGQGVTLNQNNTLRGFNIDTGSTAGAIGIEDDNLGGGTTSAGTVGSLTVSGVGITGLGKAIDIDQGGTLNVTLTSVTSGSTANNLAGSSTEGIQLAGVAGALLGGTFTVTGGTTIRNADTVGIQVSTTAASAAFNFGTTTVTDDFIGAGRNGNGIDLSTAIGATNAFNFGTALSITTDGGFGLKAVSAGTLAFGGGTNAINATGGAAVDITSTTLSGATFGTVSSSGSSTYGINLVNQVSGAFTANAGTIGTADTAGVHISGGTTAATIASAINSSNGIAVDISGHATGTIALSGTINHTSGGDKGIVVASNTSGTINFTGQTTIASTTANGVDLTSNTGTIIDFSAITNGLDITTTTGTGFNATGGGTVTVHASGSGGSLGNTISASSGTGLNINGTQIGAAHVIFEKISSGGGANNGIVLVNTGTAAGNGGLHVTGNGATVGASGGGVIANKTGADANLATQGTGIYLNSTKDVQLNGLQMNDFQNYGISGTNVAGFTLDHTTINGTNGNLQSGIGEGAVYFTGLSGTASVANSSFSGSAYDTFHVFNNGETLNRLTITGSSFAMTNTTGSDAIGLQATGGTFNVTVQSSAITSARGDLFQLNLLGTVSSDLVFGGATGALGNTLTNNNANIVSGGGGVTIGGGGPANNITLTYNIAHNSISGSHGAVLAVTKGTGTNGSFTGTIDSNVIGTQGSFGSGSTQGEGIAVFVDGAGTSTTTITNNHVSGVVGSRGAIDVFVHNGAAGKMSAIVQGNTIDTLDQANSFAGMYFQTGSNPGAGGDNNLANLTIGGAGALANNINIGPNAASAIVAGIVLEQEGVSRVGLLGTPSNYGSTPYNYAAVQTYIAGKTTGTFTNGTAVFAFGDATTPAGGGYFGAAQFLLAAPDGVESSSHSPGELNLTQTQVDSVVAAAIAHWDAAGVSASQLAVLRSVTVDVAQLSGNELGAATARHITLDNDAGGLGWFVDPTPFDDAEFTHALSSTRLETDPTEAAAGHIDLLTTVMHELGHQIGLGDLYDGTARDDLMFGTLAAGERRLPDAADAAAAAQQPGFTHGSDAFAFGQAAHAAASAANAGGFDAQYYLAHNPDVAASGVDPLQHFETFGWHEGRNPNASFDTAGYLAHYADVAAAGVNPLQHYVEFGWHEGRDPSAAFDTNGYLAANPDVAAANVNPLLHYLQAGIHEGRAPVNDGLWHV